MVSNTITHIQRPFNFQLHQKLQNAIIVEKIKIYDNTNGDLKYYGSLVRSCEYSCQLVNIL